MAGSSDEAVGCLVVIVIVIAVAYNAPSFLWGEREGIIKTDDCRSRVLVKPNTSDTGFKKFTCIYNKTQKSTLINKTCESVEASGNTCSVDYFYQEEGPKVCNDPKYPYLHSDDLCYVTPY